MNVHPSAVVNPPGLATTEPFAPEALYELKIDTNGDAVADIAYRVRFAISEDGSQTATLCRADGAQAAGTDDGGRLIVKSAPVSMGEDARVTEAGEYRFFAGWRSDPFFFDTQGALNNLQFTGHRRSACNRGLHRAEHRAAERHGRTRDLRDRPRGHQRDLRGNRQELATAAGRHRHIEAARVSNESNALRLQSGVCRVRPCQAKGASAPHYSSWRISKECAEGCSSLNTFC